MIWTTCNGERVILQLPSHLLDKEDLKMAEKAIALQLKTWRREMLADIASRWTFPTRDISPETTK